jgi:hypothetical protein
MDRYLYEDPPEIAMRELLPEGDYSFVVAAADKPSRNDNGNWVLHLKLSIQPNGTPVWANPWAGTDRLGERRDGIAEFLNCVNRKPNKGQEPDWDSLVGAKGKCRIVQREEKREGAYKGKLRNEVHYFYTPKAVKTGAPQEEKQQSFSQSDFQKARKQQQVSAGGEPEPDSIPY